jgi:RHS repeat-associated protein
VGGVTTQYLVDDRNHTGYAQVLEEVVNGTVQRRYTYGLDLISQNQASGVSFYGYDGHGSVRLLTDVNGNVTDTYTYEAFGNLIASTGATPNNFLYTGEQSDPNLGFYYLRARYLNAGVGRFWTMDTFVGNASEPFSLHKYLYANNDPVNRIDPNGLLPSLVEISVVNAIIGIIVQHQLSAAARTLDLIPEFLFTDKAQDAHLIAKAKIALAALELAGQARAAVNISALGVRLLRTSFFTKFLSKLGLTPGRGIPVYRVQGGIFPKASKHRIQLDDTGRLGIQGSDYLFINVDQSERAFKFLAKRGQDSYLVRFEVHPSFIDKVRNLAVPERLSSQLPNRPLIVDPLAGGNLVPDQYGIPPSLFGELMNNIIPGTVAIGL